MDETSVGQILRLAGEVRIPVPRVPFIAHERVKLDVSPNAEVRVCEFGSEFRELYLNPNSKAKRSIRRHPLYYYDTQGDLANCQIIDELGGLDKAEVLFWAAWYRLTRQGNGEPGALLVNGGLNLFCIPDIEEVQRMVVAIWIKNNGWYLGTNTIQSQIQMPAGLRVFSPSLSVSELATIQ